MQYKAGVILAIAGFTAAQASSTAAAGVTPSASAATSSSTSSSGCGTAIDNIIAACLASMQPQLQACAQNDWDCMCTQSQNVLTCYNNCPSDPNAFGTQQTQTSYCNAAKAYGSTRTSSSTASASASGSPSLSSALPSVSSAVNSETTTANSGFASATSDSASATHAAASASKTAPSGANMIVPGFAAMLGFAALL